MASTLTKIALTPVAYLLPDRAGHFVLGRLLKELRNEVVGEATDKFLELLLDGMDLAFLFSKDYRSNIKDFTGRYLFQTADGKVKVSAVFGHGDMKVYKEGIKNPDVTVTFKNAPALLKFLFSENQDILNSLLANEVETDGNVNYIMKFGFMARDLFHRTSLA